VCAYAFFSKNPGFSCVRRTKIGDVNEGIVERGEDTGNAKDEFALTDLRTERDVLCGTAPSDTC